ncbi:MAG: 50S ribosomal protein L11 methyltransferase [Bacteroidales bacterium]|nr:50S ribosomal protein L11 methyltransferase [Bacteroidales bacterium]
MNYYEAQIKIKPFSEEAADVISALLGEIGYESFIIEDDVLLAYINEKEYSQDLLKGVLKELPIDVETEYSSKVIEQKNWNEEWEKNYFQPIIIEGRCVIHSTFHKNIPNAEYDILIDPKMAFGTGHHETTSQMLMEILENDFNNKTVLDMGCGTAVLAILAVMKGAKSARAIDIDDWVCDNANENIKLNNVSSIDVQCGDASLLSDGRKYDIILANINRNILLNDMQFYVKTLNDNGSLYMSGFYEEDLPFITKEAERLGLKLDNYKSKNRWVAAKFIK